MKKKLIIIGAIIIVGVIVASVFFRNKKPVYETQEVTRHELIQTVSATGDFRADTEIDLNFELVGRISEIRTTVGKEVAQGDVLAMVEDRNLSSEVAAAKAALDRAKAQSGISDEEVDRLETLVEEAKDVLSDTKKVEDKREKAAEQAVEDAEREHRDTLAYYNRVLSESGADSSVTKSAKLTLNRAESALNAAKKAEETAEKAKDLSITTAENTVKTAEENLDKAKSKSQTKFDDATVAAAQAQYDIAVHNLDKAALKAPVSGKITKVNRKRGEILTNALSTPFAQMIAKDLIIEANISESDIAKVQVGNKGIVTFDALGDEAKFEVEVFSIEPAATIVQDVVYYEVKFKLDNSYDPRLKPGMTANIDIETNKKANVIAIPERLLKEENDERYVEILENNQPKRVTVKLGMRGDGGLIEVLNGLKEGDRLITNSPQQ